MGHSAEDRLRRVEKLLEMVIRKLEGIEEYLKTLGFSSDVLSTALKLTISFSLPASKAVEASRRIIEALGMLGTYDAIDRAIIEALSNCEELSISEITRRVRRLRGTASRRIVAERIRRLEDRGVVAKVGRRRFRYVLSRCLTDEHK